ncbi:E3 ubiquitin-protein ligase CHFR [Lamellibrachia satsuma]|nr:E3 ubiquitin-protein ligase CHFR [Lamellibrachia satsuma]
MAIKDLLTQCCHKLETGEFPQIGRVTPDMVVCYRCALTELQTLAYLYRKAIPNDQLPTPVTLRPDCYWGKHCRTQLNKPPHAARYNHICEQTRRT